MNWKDGGVYPRGATRAGYAAIGTLTCGHQRVIELKPDVPVPMGVPCPICDEHRDIPKGFVWSDVAGRAVDERPRRVARRKATEQETQS